MLGGKGGHTGLKSRNEDQKNMSMLARGNMSVHKVYCAHTDMTKKYGLPHGSVPSCLAWFSGSTSGLDTPGQKQQVPAVLPSPLPVREDSSIKALRQSVLQGNLPTNLLCFAARRDSTDNQNLVCPIQELCKPQICLSFFCAKDLAARSRHKVQFCWKLLIAIAVKSCKVETYL